jgi:hypothetical protein
MTRYIVQYRLDYVHRVQVGIEADSSEAAIDRAQAAFDNATLWEDTAQLPLLFDDYEEVDGQPLIFEVVAEVETWPEPESSVLHQRRATAAERACRLLVEAYRRGEESGGSVAWEDLDTGPCRRPGGPGWKTPPKHPRTRAGDGGCGGRRRPGRDRQCAHGTGRGGLRLRR